ncbi:iron transporter, partial [Streptomyces sp. NRRL S-444]
MESVDLNAAADAYAGSPLLNCLLREAADPAEESGTRTDDARAGHVHRLRGSGRLLRVRGGRRPVRPELRTADGWHALSHTELVKLTADELHRYTGAANDELPVEIADSREAVAALLAARAAAAPPQDPYVLTAPTLV